MVSTKTKWTPDMTQDSNPIPVTRKRRYHSREFKSMVVQASNAPGNSTAGVAQKYQLNANLIHKWRRELAPQLKDEFIPLPAPA